MYSATVHMSLAIKSVPGENAGMLTRYTEKSVLATPPSEYEQPYHTIGFRQCQFSILTKSLRTSVRFFAAKSGKNHSILKTKGVSEVNGYAFRNSFPARENNTHKRIRIPDIGADFTRYFRLEKYTNYYISHLVKMQLRFPFSSKHSDASCQILW